MRAKILAIDDNLENLQVLFELLTEIGYTVFTVEDGQSALVTARETSPDLILLDVLMEEAVTPTSSLSGERFDRSCKLSCVTLITGAGWCCDS